jgi:hypothetical protein
MVEAVETRLLENATEAEDKAPANMAGTATPATVSTITPVPASKVDIVEVVAAAAALGVARPETTHTTAAFKGRGLPSSIFKWGEVYVAVIVPEMALPALVHVAVGVLAEKEVKPVTVITSAAVAVAPVNPTVMEVAVEMRSLENATEAEVKGPAAAQAQVAANRNKIRIRRTIQIRCSRKRLSLSGQY